MLEEILKTKKPEELPNITTIRDILLELEDTGRFDLNYSFDQIEPFRPFNFYEAKFNYSQICSQYEQPVSQRVEVIENRYLIQQVMCKILILQKEFFVEGKRLEMTSDIKDILSETIQRIEDYLGSKFQSIKFVHNNVVIIGQLYNIKNL